MISDETSTRVFNFKVSNRSEIWREVMEEHFISLQRYHNPFYICLKVLASIVPEKSITQIYLNGQETGQTRGE